MVCEDQLAVDLCHGKRNPRLVLRLYPHGIEEDYDKNATLDIGIKIPTNCPRIHSTTEVEVVLSAWDCKESKLLSAEQVVTVSLNQRTFLVKQFLSHDALKHSRSDIVEIRAAVQRILHSKEYY